MHQKRGAEPNLPPEALVCPCTNKWAHAKEVMGRHLSSRALKVTSFRARLNKRELQFDEDRKSTVLLIGNQYKRFSYTGIGNARIYFCVLAYPMAGKVVKSPIDWYIINKVREMRTQKGISQDDIAVHLNLSTGFIGHIESPNFRAKYNAQHLNELAKLLQCSPKDFLPEEPI